MNALKKYAISDLYDMSSGISTGKGQAGHGSPFVSFSTVFNNYFLPDVLPDLMNTSTKEQDTYSIKKGDILITRTSETINELAMSCVALKDYPAATYSGFTKRLRPKTERIAYYKYLAFYLRGYLFRTAVTNNAFMTLRASFNEDIFSFLNLYLPDYDQQVLAGDLLYRMEQKIQLNNRINAELEAMAKTLYDYWFVQFDFPDKNGKPYRSSGGKMVWNEQLKREIPKGWAVSTLSDVANITMGQSPSGDSYNENGDGMPFFQGSTDFGVDFPMTRVYTTQPSRIAAQGDILLSVRAPVGTINTAYEKCCIGRGLAALNSKIGASTYLQCLLAGLKPFFDMLNGNGTTFGSLTKDTLFEATTIIPRDYIINAFERIVGNYAHERFNNEKQTRELTNLRDWLLPMLMNGQAAVSDSENSSDNVIPIEQKDEYDQRFNLWLKNQGIAARGDIDRKTLREIFDAMDDDDKQ